MRCVRPVITLVRKLGPGREFAARCPARDAARMDAVPVCDPALRVPAFSFGLRVHSTLLVLKRRNNYAQERAQSPLSPALARVSTEIYRESPQRGNYNPIEGRRSPL